jgi:mRNA interferase RelE/StbE
MYNITYTKNAEKYLEKLNKDQKERILNSIERTRIKPERYFERLVGVKSYKLRVGDYRVIADIYKEELVILAIKVGHRKNIYD